MAHLAVSALQQVQFQIDSFHICQIRSLPQEGVSRIPTFDFDLYFQEQRAMFSQLQKLPKHGTSYRVSAIQHVQFRIDSFHTWHNYAPLTLKSNKGWPSSPLEPSEGAFELTHGSACIIGWYSGLPDSLISTYIAQFMRCAIGRIHYDLKVVFCFWHFTAFHYHHYTILLTGTEYI